MTKKKKPPVEAFDTQGGQNLPEGYTWCPECQASFQGEVCPGCSIGISPGIAAFTGLETERPKTTALPGGDKAEEDVRACDQCEDAMTWANYGDKQGWLCEKCDIFVQIVPPPEPTTLAEPDGEVMDRVIITRGMVGIAHMQVCAVEDATDEEILKVCNRENPSGTTLGWSSVLRQNPKPVVCESYPERRHFLVEC